MSPTNSSSWLSLKRIVRFGETDAAGVMHFHQLFRWCHEAWEESLDCYGVPAFEVFPNSRLERQEPTVALPIVHCRADFRRPIITGDHLDIELKPLKIDPSCFQVQAHFQKEGDDVAVGLLRHIAICASTRKRCELPKSIDLWLEASSIDNGVKPL